jgi:hypothetical protein
MVVIVVVMVIGVVACHGLEDRRNIRSMSRCRLC